MPPEGFGKNSGREYRCRTEDISCADADRDERKHIKTAVDDRLPGPGEEKAARPKNHRRR